MNQQNGLIHLPIAIEGKDLVSLILRDEDFVWLVDKDVAADFLRFCWQEGVTGLVFKALKNSGKLAGTPKAIRTGLAGSQIAGKWIHHLVDAELAAVVQEFSAQGLQALIFKGSALAHVLYPEPWLRIGGDSDILIRSGDRKRVENILIGLGYERHMAVSGKLLMKQASYSRNRDGYKVILDVQWDFSQAQVLSGLLPFDDLYAESRQIPDLGPHARTFSKVDSLILACAHWMGHINDRKLVWLFDIHLLVESLMEREQINFYRVAQRKGVCAICLHTLRQAQKCFDTQIPDGMESALKKVEALGLERSAHLIQEKTRADRILGDLLSVPGWRKKIQLALEHLFPSVDYMRYRYGHSNCLLLPFLYARRALKGLMKMTR